MTTSPVNVFGIQRSGAEGGFVAQLDQSLLGGLRDLEANAAVGEQLAQVAQLDVGDAERAKWSWLGV